MSEWYIIFYIGTSGTIVGLDTARTLTINKSSGLTKVTLPGQDAQAGIVLSLMGAGETITLHGTIKTTNLLNTIAQFRQLVNPINQEQVQELYGPVFTDKQPGMVEMLLITYNQGAPNTFDYTLTFSLGGILQISK